MPDQRLGAYNIADLREMARRKLPHGLFEHLDRGTEDEMSLRNNRAAFERIRFKPRTLIDVSKRSQAVTLFGKPAQMPVMIGPTGFGGLCAYEGEIALAKAAVAAGVPFVVGMGSLTSMEKVVEHARGGTLWFQLTMWRDRDLTRKLVERVHAAGFEALVVTVDGAVPANREYTMRNGFTIPFTLSRRSVVDIVTHPGWMLKVFTPYFMRGGIPRHQNYPEELRRRITTAPLGRAKHDSATLSWDDLRALRKAWPHPLIVKGILTAQDAVAAADCGADGVIISNHGGRHLDFAVAPIEVLPEIVAAVGNRITVLVDSGFRRGSDVVKALALGAKMVLLGRAPLYGLTAAGEPGVARALTIFREEVDRVMALLGCNSVAELGPHILSRDAAPLRESAPRAVESQCEPAA